MSMNEISEMQEAIAAGWALCAIGGCQNRCCRLVVEGFTIRGGA